MSVEYNRIPILLKRYSFKSKMDICQYSSRKLMKYYTLDISDHRNAFPWEVDCFALFSILTNDEYQFNEFSGAKHIRYFNQMINAIRQYVHPKLKEDAHCDFLEHFVLVTGPIQFKAQEDIRHRLYRYRYIFNYINRNINMRDEFFSKFGFNYDDIMIPSFVLFFFFSFNRVNPNIFNYITNSYPSLKALIISRDDFISRQIEKLPHGIDSYYYSFKYFYPYPFVEENGSVYLPIPYLLIDAITDSLLTRMTFGNNLLRSMIGKEVIENYLYDILLKSRAYVEVIREYKYKIGKAEYSTPDVMVRDGNSCILFDCKTLVPRLMLRDFDDITINDTIKICAENIVQLYKRTMEFGLHYNPFEINTIDKTEIFGVVVLLEENYVSKLKIYQRASKLLNLTEGSADDNYLRSNVKIISIKDIESCTHVSSSYVGCLRQNRDNKQSWYNFSICEIDKDERPDYLTNFIVDLQKSIEHTTNELVHLGMIPLTK